MTSMSGLLIDGAMIGITALAGHSIMGSWRQFKALFLQLRTDMAMTAPPRSLSVMTLSTSADAVPAMAYRPEFGVVSNRHSTLGIRASGMKAQDSAAGIRPRSLRRPAALRAAA